MMNRIEATKRQKMRIRTAENSKSTEHSKRLSGTLECSSKSVRENYRVLRPATRAENQAEDMGH